MSTTFYSLFYIGLLGALNITELPLELMQSDKDEWRFLYIIVDGLATGFSIRNCIGVSTPECVIPLLWSLVRVFRTCGGGRYLHYAEIKNDNRVAARMLTQMFAGNSHVFICFANCCHLEGILPNQYTRKFAARANFSVFCFLNWYCPPPNGRTRFRMLQSELDLERIGEPPKTITYLIIYVSPWFRGFLASLNLYLWSLSRFPFVNSFVSAKY